MHDFDCVDDGVLVDSVGRRVGDHNRRQVLRVLFGLLLQVRQVDLAAFCRLYCHDLHSRHERRGRVCPVRRNRNQADVPVSLSRRLQEIPDCQQSRVLPRRSAVRLEAKGVELRDRLQPSVQLPEHFVVPLRLVQRNHRVHVHLRQRKRNQRRRRVAFHCARPQRNHRLRQRDVAVLEQMDVAQHLRLGLVVIEDPLLHEPAFSLLAQRLH